MDMYTVFVIGSNLKHKGEQSERVVRRFLYKKNENRHWNIRR